MLASRKNIVLALTALMIGGCADVGPPPGGPEDKQGPTILESVPQNGAVNETNVRFVEIKLSETVNTPKDTRLSISPRPSTPPKVHWSEHAIRVEFAEPLLSNRTYIISLPSDLSDLRGNRTDSAISVAFSTGPTLDSCAISGTVFSDESPAPGITVGLYSASTLQTGRGYDSLYPDYLAVTGKNGEFFLRHLPNAPFRMIAFKKSARDDRFYPTRDKFGVPDRPIDLASASNISELSIALTSQDTLPIKIISALVNNDRVVQLRLSRPLSRLQLPTADSVTISIGESRYASAPFVASDSESVSSISAWFGQLPSGVGKLSWSPERGKAAAIFDSLRITAAADTTLPSVVRVFPDSRPLLTPDTTIRIRFSEPIKFPELADSSVAMWSIADSVNILLDKTIGDAFELIVKPKALAGGASYILKIRETEILDLSGNPIGDSVSQYIISIINPDSLGWVEGSFVTTPADTVAPVNLAFRRLKDGRSFQFASVSPNFKFALPAGKYLVSGYVDRNANGQFDKGRIFPQTLSEPFLPYRDTVSVRARFETAGVELEFR